jgi:hypothetical protein
MAGGLLAVTVPAVQDVLDRLDRRQLAVEYEAVLEELLDTGSDAHG